MRKFLPAIILSCFLFIQHSFGQTPTEVTFNGIPNLANGDLDWGDFDGDGDMDLLISGWDGVAPLTRLYERDGIDFITVPFAFPNVYNGDVGFVDVNADGLLDVFITGEGVEDYYFDLYLNLGQGDFEELGLSVQGLTNSQVVWKDLSGDGYLDLIYTGTDKTGNPITDFQVWEGDQFYARGSLIAVFNGQISVNAENGFWDVMISGNEIEGKESSTFYKFKTDGLKQINLQLEEYSFNPQSILIEDLTNDGLEDFVLVPYSGLNVTSGRNLGNYFFEETVTGAEVLFPEIDTTEVAEIVNFISSPSSGAPYFLYGFGEAGWPAMEIRFGQGTQLAHRFTVNMQGQGVGLSEYIYEDYVEVPFQVWDVDNNRQLMVSFRDQQEDGEWNLIARNLNDEDPSQDSREYIFLHFSEYNETPNENIIENLGYQNMGLWWMVAQEQPTNVSEFGVSSIKIKKTVESAFGLQEPAKLTVFDFNQDGLNDIVTAMIHSNGNENGVSNLVIDFYTNDGALALRRTNRVATAWDRNVTGLDFADFDGDGYKDLILEDNGALTIYMNQEGSFINNSTSYILFGTTGFADFNNDGLFDIMDGTGEIYLSRGFNGQFIDFEELTEGPEETFPTDPYQFTIGDFNNDGLVDVVMTERDTLKYLATNLNGTEFDLAEPDWIKENNELLIINLSNQDINNDGYPDLLIEGIEEFGTYTFKILLNDQQGGMEVHPLLDFDLAASLNNASSINLTLIDIDGNGVKDLQLFTEINGSVKSLLFDFTIEGFQFRQLDSDKYKSLWSRNMDGLGPIELLAISESSNRQSIEIIELGEQLEINQLSNVLDSGLIDNVIPLDVDVDTDLDIFYSVESDSGMIHGVLKNNGNYEFVRDELISTIGNHQIIFDDLNGNGLLDYSLISNDLGNPESLFYINTGTNVLSIAPTGLDVEVVENQVIISWDTESSDSLNLRYNFKLWNESGFIHSGSTNSFSTLNLHEDQLTYDDKIHLLLDSGNYSFSVQSVNHSLGASEFSDTLNFNVSNDLKESIFQKQTVLNTIEEIALSDFADIDDDNDLDFVFFDGEFKVAINQNSQFRIATLNLDPTFEMSFPIFEWGDIDNDNDNDLVVADTRGTVIFENRGDYKFEPISTIGINALPGFDPFREGGELNMGDINGDALPDLVITGYNEERELFVGVFLNYNNGEQFRLVENPVRESTIFNTNIADLNNDGINDLYINPTQTFADSASTGLPFFILGTASTDFTERITLPAGINPIARSHIVDFDEDGDLDVVFSDGQIARNSNGEFNLETLFEAVNPFTPFYLIDYNIDGFRDLFVLDPFNTDWLINENGDFRDADDDLPALGFNGRYFLVDIDRDGDLDLSTNKYWKGAKAVNVLEIYKNQSSEISAEVTIPNSLTHTINQNGEVILHWEESDQSLTHNVVVWNHEGFLVSPNADTLSGFRRINKPGNSGYTNFYNLGVLSEGTYYWKVQNITADTHIGGTFSQTESFEIQIFEELSILDDVVVQDLQAVDIDNDNDLDIYYNNTYINDDFELETNHSILINDGNLQFNRVETGLRQHFAKCALGDINNDGWIDLVLNGPDNVDLSNFQAQDIIVSTNLNSGELTFDTKFLRGITGTNSYPEFQTFAINTVHVSDFTNDGRQDIVINGSNSPNFSRIIGDVEENGYRGKVSFLKQNIDSNFVESEFITGIGPINGISLGDYNNDGYTDLASYDNFFGFTPTGNVFVSVGYGKQQIQEFRSEQFQEETGVAWLDVDSDGDLDLFVNGILAENVNDDRLISGFSSESLEEVIDFNNDGIMDGYSISNQGTTFFIGTQNGYKKFDNNGDPYPYILLEAADLDGDGNVEMIINQAGRLKLLRADFGNSKPEIEIPGTLSSVIEDFNAILSWENIPRKGYSYNVEVSLGNNLIVSSHSDSTGFRRLLGYGNAYMNDSFILNINDLNDGRYTWKVQAVNTASLGGEFSATETFLICTEFNNIDFELPENAGVNSTLKFNPINVPENQEISYSWNFGDGTENTSTEFHQYLSSGDYNVTTLITNSFGCEKMISKELSVSDIIPVRVSNVITPNNDGKNDVLFIENIERYPDNQVRFLTLDGQQLFEATGYQNDWSPIETGFELASGTYICILKLTQNDFERKVLVRVIR